MIWFAVLVSLLFPRNCSFFFFFVNNLLGIIFAIANTLSLGGGVCVCERHCIAENQQQFDVVWTRWCLANATSCWSFQLKPDELSSAFYWNFYVIHWCFSNWKFAFKTLICSKILVAHPCTVLARAADWNFQTFLLQNYSSGTSCVGIGIWNPLLTSCGRPDAYFTVNCKQLAKKRARACYYNCLHSVADHTIHQIHSDSFYFLSSASEETSKTA